MDGYAQGEGNLLGEGAAQCYALMSSDSRLGTMVGVVDYFVLEMHLAEWNV